jgi:hypothetical protein
LKRRPIFCIHSVEKYIRDAEKDKKPEIVKLWSTMKEDEQEHLKMLRKVQGYAVSRVSVYRQQVSQFFRCMGDIQLLLEREMLPLLVADFGLSEQPDFSLESAYILIGVAV